MTLRERILTRLALAEAATPGPWAAEIDQVICNNPDVDLRWLADAVDDETAAFIVDRSPDRVIAECRADLALLDWVEGFTTSVPRLYAEWTPMANLLARYPEGRSS